MTNTPIPGGNARKPVVGVAEPGRGTGLRSLDEVHGSVDPARHKRPWRRFLAFVGPAYLISVGYMDPGNWATDLGAGAKYGYALLWVLVMSNLMALLLQSFCARLGIVRQLDLAQASREQYPPIVNGALWVLAELAIAACDLAEVLGMAIGLNLLFGLPLMWGVGLSVADTLVLMVLQHYGVKRVEAFIIGLVAIIGISFLVELIIAKPVWGDVATGLVPSMPDWGPALYLTIGIIGATVMPHNLYLHSALVQTRKVRRDATSIREAIKFNLIDTTIALNLAFFVNAAILILAGTVFYNSQYADVSRIEDAHRLLEPLLGTVIASKLFAIALIASGQSSTITGTLAGQVVMEGYLRLRIRPWLRRLMTRVLAVGPALITIYLAGEDSTEDLLVLSQVILSMQLGFAVVPLLHFVSDRKRMGEHTIKRLAQAAGWLIVVIVVGLNSRLVFQTLVDGMAGGGVVGNLTTFVGLPIAAFAAGLLVYVVVQPLIGKRHSAKGIHAEVPMPVLPSARSAYKRICVALDFTRSDASAISTALGVGGQTATYILVHVVESAMARTFGDDANDAEAHEDEQRLQTMVQTLASQGYRAAYKLGYGRPADAIIKLTMDTNADLIVLASHGHAGFTDVLRGETVDKVRHGVTIPVLIAPVPKLKL